MAFLNYLIVPCILNVCFILYQVEAQDPVTLEATPSQNVPIGDEFTLKCSFAVTKAEFQKAEVLVNDRSILNYTESLSGDQPGITKYEGTLSEDAGTNSELQVTLKAEYCGDNSRERNYDCLVTNAQGDITSGSTPVTFEEPEILIEVADTPVCEDGAEKYTFKSSEILGKLKSIKFISTQHNSRVTGLTFLVEDKSFEPWAKEDEEALCSYGGIVGGFYTFNDMKEYEMTYTVKTEDGEITGTCTIDIIDENATTAPGPDLTQESPTASNQTASGNGEVVLYGSTIALIITIVAVALLGLIGLWYLHLVKEGRAAPPPLTKRI